MLRRELERDRWLIDGNYDRTLSVRPARCDTVIWLDYPRHICLWGVAKRTFSYWGRSLPDMAEGCPERVDWEFLRYIWRYNQVQGIRMKGLLDDCGKAVLHFRNRRECAQFLLQRF